MADPTFADKVVQSANFGSNAGAMPEAPSGNPASADPMSMGHTPLPMPEDHEDENTHVYPQKQQPAAKPVSKPKASRAKGRSTFSAFQPGESTEVDQEP